jgi:glycosyltransferase involved in cell wall biosynthesis
MALWMGSTYEAASEIVTTTQETLSKIPAKYRHKSRSQQAIGIDFEGLMRLRPNLPNHRMMQDSSRLELLYVGRLLPWKGLHLVLKTLALLDASHPNLHLSIVGSGRDLPRLQRLARRVNVDAIVSWIPWMPREELIGVYSSFDLFMFPSLHDSGGSAVLEALTFGLPVVCLDLGGPATAVNDSCGRVISTAGRSEEQVVKAIAQFLTEILADRSILRRLSETARAHAATLTWQANVDSMYGSSLVGQPN